MSNVRSFTGCFVLFGLLGLGAAESAHAGVAGNTFEMTIRTLGGSPFNDIWRFDSEGNVTFDGLPGGVGTFQELDLVIISFWRLNIVDPADFEIDFAGITFLDGMFLF